MNCLKLNAVRAVSEARTQNGNNIHVIKMKYDHPQQLEPKCMETKMRINGGLWFPCYDYLFESKDYTVCQSYCSWDHPQLLILDKNNLIMADAFISNGTHVEYGERLFQHSYYNEFEDDGTLPVSKELLDSIIYKIMVGDLKLFDKELLYDSMLSKATEVLQKRLKA